MNLLRPAARLAACILFISPLTRAAWSQAAATAIKSQEISIFGAASGGSTDFGPRTYVGASTGVDYTFFPRWRVAPSVEVRAATILGQEATENTVQFGPRLQMDIHDRYHPYIDGLYGGGEIKFHPFVLFQGIGYTGDRTSVLSYGGGINIDVTHHFGAKFDIQGQSWNFGKSIFGNGDFTITPVVASAGLVYTIPAGKLSHHKEFR
jgi:hypothetical protein